MASFVTFNGITKYFPGGIVKIGSDALVQTALSENGIVGLIGECEGGAPNTIVALDDATRTRELLRSGPLADAINVAFAPSGDPLIPSGASRILVYKTNQSTQSTVTLPGDAAVREISAGVVSGGAATTLLASTLAATTVDNQFNGMWIVLRPNGATQEIKQITTYTATGGTFNVGSSWSANPTAADAFLVLQDTSVLVGEVDASSTTTSVTVLAGTMTINEHVGRWVKLYRSGLPIISRKITANSATALTVSPALPAAPVAATTYFEILPSQLVLTSKDYGAHTNSLTVDVATAGSGAKIVTVSFEGKDEISPEIGNFPFMKLLFRGAPIAISDTVAASSTASVINVTTAGLSVNAHAGRQVYIDGEYTTIVSNTVSALTVSPALSAAPTLAGTVTIFSITKATAKISGASGAATGITTATGVVGADLSIAFVAGMTLRQLVAAINLNTNYLAVIPNGINADTIFVKDFDFGVTISILNSATLVTTGFMQNTSQMVNYFNQVAQYVSAVRASTGVKDGSLTAGDIADPLPFSGAIRGISANSNFQAGFDALLNVRVNHIVPLIDRDLTNEGFGSTATVASVAQQLKSHVIAARGAVSSERGGYIGFRGTKAQILAQAAAINDPDVAICPQSPTLLNLSGTLQTFGPAYQAVMAAGSRAGAGEIGEPLTNKLLNASAVTSDVSWNASNLTDANDLIKGGVLFAYTNEAGVTKWVRDLTTWISDNNLALSEGSIRDVVRYVAYGLRKTVMDKYTGRKAKLATILNIKNTAVTLLEQYRSNSIIVDSTDPITGLQSKAYYGLKITATGDVFKLCVGFFPVPGINFGLFDLSLGIASQSV